MVLFVVHAGRWDTRDTCNDITTVTGMTVTAHNIGNEFVDEKFANRSDCTIRLLSFFLTSVRIKYYRNYG